MKWVLPFLSLAVLANAATFVLNMSPQECQEGEECSRYTKPPQRSASLRQDWYIDDYYPVDITYPGFDDWDWPIQEPNPEEFPPVPPTVVDEDAVSVSPDVEPTPNPEETPAPPTVVTNPATEESTRKPTSADSSTKPDSEDSTRKPNSPDSSPKPAAPARNTTPATSVNEETNTTPAKPNRSSFRSMPSKNRSNGSLEVRVILPPKLP